LLSLVDLIFNGHCQFGLLCRHHGQQPALAGLNSSTSLLMASIRRDYFVIISLLTNGQHPLGFPLVNLFVHGQRPLDFLCQPCC
jgi:hypothetical protein